MASLSYCQVLIGRSMTGLVGLQEAMEALAEAGVPVDAPDLGQRLVDEVRKHNYVPQRAMEEYKAALAREYRRYLEARASGESGRVWRDPRKAHNWYPTIFAEKCDGCGACLPVCTRNVLARGEDGKVIVLEPYACAEGCLLCARACTRGAIVMPPREALHRNLAVSGGEH
ncbi:MAG: 4Fe-4S binding protein [Chloroflexi bacterium]|nr:4Fe-4S binding protein [Chloroflexota bacterium]